LTRGEIWWAELGTFRPQQQTGRRPVIIVQSNALLEVLQSVLVVPLTANIERARLAGTAFIVTSADGPSQDSVALAFQMRAIPRKALRSRIRALTDVELAELELALDEALGRVEPERA
jgi:mRNA interferase MazF